MKCELLRKAAEMKTNTFRSSRLEAGTDSRNSVELSSVEALLQMRFAVCFCCDNEMNFISPASPLFTMQDSRVVSVFRVRALCSVKGNARESLFSFPSKLDYFPSSPGAGARNETTECAISLGSITLALSPFAEAPHGSSKTKNNA